MSKGGQILRGFMVVPGLMMVLLRGIDRKCVASTGLTGELEESLQLSHHSMTEGSVRARDGVEGWGEMLLQ